MAGKKEGDQGESADNVQRLQVIKKYHVKAAEKLHREKNPHISERPDNGRFYRIPFAGELL